MKNQLITKNMEEHFFTLSKKGTPEEYLALMSEHNGYIRVANQNPVIKAIDKNSYPNSLKVNAVAALKCKVDINPFTEDGKPLSKNGGYKSPGETELKTPILIAFVLLPEVCPYCDGAAEVFVYKE